MTAPLPRIAAAFDRADRYDSAARVQRHAALMLANRIDMAFREAPPNRILEFGCGTGFLTGHLRRLFPQADILATDIAPNMLRRAAERLAGQSIDFAVMDAETAENSGRFDLVCSNFCAQWLMDQPTAFAHLACLLAPGGRLMFTTLAEGSFDEWRQSCADASVPCGLHRYPDIRALTQAWPIGGRGEWSVEPIVDTPESALSFLRDLRAIGAHAPPPGSHSAGAMLRRAIRQFDESGHGLTYQVAFGQFERAAPFQGVFISGTDTGVGKTLVSACLTRAWNATYWKPLQSGLDDEEGDTPTVSKLSGADASRLLPPAYALGASLSPLAAAKASGHEIELTKLECPEIPTEPVIIEGAGGLLVPATETLMMIDLAALYNMPVLLVARSGLGTINHTLLSIEALKRRGIPIAGVVLNGPANPGNKAAIERFGAVKVIAEIPLLTEVTPEAVAAVAGRLPAYGSWVA